VLLICERCNRYWRPQRGKKRQNICPKCAWLGRSAGAKKREARKRIVAQTLSAPAGEAGAPARPFDADELLRLMADADSAAARALELARRIGAKLGS